MDENSESKPKDTSSIQESTMLMVQLNMDRSIKFDSTLSMIEEMIFSVENIQSYRNDPEALLKLYGKIFYYKVQSESFVLKVMELSSKNDIIKKFLNSMLGDNVSRIEEDSVTSEDKEKVHSALKFLQGFGINKTHGTNSDK